MRSLALAIISGLTLVSTQVLADSANKVYAGLGYSVLADSDVSFGSIQARLGYNLGPNFAIEAEAGFGVTEEDFFGFKAKAENTFSAFVVGKVPAGDKFHLLGRVGYTNVKLSVEGFGAEGSDNIDSIAVGIGGQYMFNDNNGLRGDYTRLIEGGGSNTFTVGYVRKF